MAINWAQVLAGGAQGALRGVEQRRLLERQAFADAMVGQRHVSAMMTGAQGREHAAAREGRAVAGFETPAEISERHLKEFQERWVAEDKLIRQAAAQTQATAEAEVAGLLPEQQGPVMAPATEPVMQAPEDWFGPQDSPQVFEQPALMEPYAPQSEAERAAAAGYDYSVTMGPTGLLMPAVQYRSPEERMKRDLDLRNQTSITEMHEAEWADYKAGAADRARQAALKMDEQAARTLVTQTNALLTEMDYNRAKLLDPQTTANEAARLAIEQENLRRTAEMMIDNPEHILGMSQTSGQAQAAADALALRRTPSGHVSEMGPRAAAIAQAKIDFGEAELAFEKEQAQGIGAIVAPTAAQSRAVPGGVKLIQAWLDSQWADDRQPLSTLDFIVESQGGQATEAGRKFLESMAQRAREAAETPGESLDFRRGPAPDQAVAGDSLLE